MQIALKKQAETYFQSFPDFQHVHNSVAGVQELEKFYTLLIYRYLPNNQLTSKIKILYQSKKLQWQPLINAVWALSLILADSNATLALLAQFITSIDCLNIVDRNLLLKSLPQNLIELAGLQKKQALEKKSGRARRKFYFDQKKHNLMRQNNEGFARLSLLLATLGQAHSHELVWNKIISLIGNFDLDPDRVLDLLIQSYLQSNNSQIYYALIKKFNPQSITALIGNRILKDCPTQISQKLIYAGKVQNFLTGTPQELYKQVTNIANPKLINLACTYIQQNFIKMESIVPYLTPSDSVFQNEQIKRLQYGKQKILKSFKLVMEQKTKEQLALIKQEENLKILGQLLHSSKLAFINGFVCINDWSNFTNLWNNYKSKVDLVIYQPLLRSLLNMLQWVIDPLYRKSLTIKNDKFQYKLNINFPIREELKQNPEQQSRIQMSQCKQLTDRQFRKINELFQIIHIYVGFQSRLYIKICRLLTNIIKKPHIFSSSQNQNQCTVIEVQLSPFVKQSIQNIIRLYLVPGISLQTGNPSLTKQIYQLLELFNYRFRYHCYLHHYYQGMTTNPLLAHIFYKTRDKQTVIANNLSDKNKKVFMKKMAKLTHNQALQTFYWIFRRILMEDYEKVVPQIVGVLANCCPLTLQMTIFIALHILNEQKQPAMNFKTGEQTPWFKNLINFISLFYRKYLQIDIQPVFDYIIMKIGQDVSQLQQNQQLPGALLGLLHEILSKMFCNFVLKQVNKSKLQTLCAGPYLQLQAMDISSQIKASKKSKVILEKFFWGKSVDQYDGQSLAISLLVLLTQKRAELLHKSYISNLKIIGDIYDDYTVLIIQLIRVLNQLSSGYIQYSKLLPENSLNLLINQYKLPIQIAFQIYRPSIKHISTMSAQQWSQFVKYIGEVINNFFTSQNRYIKGYSQNQLVKSYLSQNYSKISTLLSNQFFATFWMLTLDSIYFPAKLYTQKLEQVKKKAQTKNLKGGNKPQKNQREIQKAKTLLLNLKNQQVSQSKKYQETVSQTNLSRLKIQFLKNGAKDDKSNSLQINQFAQVFVQICLLPRMMLDPQEALYCMKITVQVIKLNKLSSNRSIKLLIFIIEHVMNYLPYATQRQASYCLAIFLSEILNVLANWNDPIKLKQDLKKWLGVEQSFVQTNYPRLKKQFIKLYIRFGNIVKSIKDQPYNIRNCLYLLEKVDFIPAYKKQAEDFENYLKQLKQKYSNTLITIIQMQLSIIGQKKKTLPVIQEDGQVSASRTEIPTFSNLAVIQQKSQIPSKSPARSPIRVKGQVSQKSNNIDVSSRPGNYQFKSQPKKQIKIASQKQAVKYKQKENPHEVQKYKDKDKESKIERQKQMFKNNKPQTPINLDKSQSNQSKQNGQRQLAINVEKNQQKIIYSQSTTASAPIPVVVEPAHIGPQNPKNEIQNPSSSNPPISFKKIQAQRQITQMKQPGLRLETVQPAQRIKTVKEKRDEDARRAAQNLQPLSDSLTKQLQPQINEKIKKQSKKDQVTPRSQKVQWPNQSQKEEKDKQKIQIQILPTTQPIVQFSRKGSFEDKRNTINVQMSQTQQVEQTENPKVAQQIQNNAAPVVEIQAPRQSPVQKVQPTIKNLQKKDQQYKKQVNKISRDKSSDKQRQKDRERQRGRDSKFEWKKTDRQDRFSPDRNQDRQYKSRQFDKRQKDQRPWKQREQYRERDRHGDDRNEKRKDSRDRSSRRKQDKYDKYEKSRKHDHKPKDRSRER